MIRSAMQGKSSTVIFRHQCAVPPLHEQIVWNGLEAAFQVGIHQLGVT